jgi:hypothetical protein
VEKQFFTRWNHLPVSREREKERKKEREKREET